MKSSRVKIVNLYFTLKNHFFILVLNRQFNWKVSKCLKQNNKEKETEPYNTKCILFDIFIFFKCPYQNGITFHYSGNLVSSFEKSI